MRAGGIWQKIYPGENFHAYGMWTPTLGEERTATACILCKGSWVWFDWRYIWNSENSKWHIN